MAKAV